MVEELPEQVELLRGETNLLVADVDLPLPRVDDEVSVPKLLRLRATALRRCAAEHALDPCDELARIERLRHVVVGANLEPDDLVDVLVAGREHEDRHVRVLADASAELDPVAVRQVEVENDQGGGLLRDLDERCLGGRRRAHAVASVLQIGGDERGDRRLVLDDQNAVLFTHCVPSAKRSRSSGSGVQLVGSRLQSTPSRE